MRMQSRPAVMAVVVAVGSLIALPGCEWFQGTESGQNLKPFLSSLSVNPSSVLCGDTFSVSFRYDDPQGDIATVTVALQRVGSTGAREETPAWPENQSRSSGVVTFGGFSFPCDASAKGGAWSITVKAVDDRGHTSNVLAGQIRLNAPS